MLYITAQFWFGFWSVFAGQPLYDPYIYQMYNFAFTGINIMFYAIFDFEYPKEVLRSKPSLYGIGLRNEKFSFLRFWIWVLFGWV